MNILKNTQNLAWKGVTVSHKQKLLEYSIAERDRLISEGKEKEGYLTLASVCHDIISTAKAALKDIAVDEAEGWEKLINKATQISKEAVLKAEKFGKENWSSTDYQVAGSIYLDVANDVRSIEHASTLFMDGIAKAESEINVPTKILLLGQVVRSLIARNDKTSVASAMADLHNAIIGAGTVELNILTRAYRALAEGGKFLAIQYAQGIKSGNQELKARNV